MKYLILFTLLFACGGQGYVETQLIPDPDGWEFSGTADQDTRDQLRQTADEFVDDVPVADQAVIQKAIIYQAPYGSEPDAERCVAPWLQGKCFIPKTKTIKLKINTCAPSCQPVFAQAYTDAANAFTVMAAADGFNVSVVTSGQNITLQNGDAGGVAFGSTSNAANSLDDVQVSGIGTFKRFTVSVSTVDFDQIIHNFPGWIGFSDNQKIRVLHNIVKHELGHAMGLGHNPTPNQLMTSGTISSPSSASELLFTSQENSFASAYNPNG